MDAYERMVTRRRIHSALDLVLLSGSGRTSVADPLALGALERFDSVAVRGFNFRKGFRWQCE
jgi:hypothetical protein